MAIVNKKYYDDGNSFDSSLKTSLEEDSERLIYVSDGGDSDSKDVTSSSPSCGRNFADFSNVFKAFIGSSLIGLPFAVSKAGIILGAIGMVIIATLTAHCCHLIVKCKRYAIDKVCDQLEENGADDFTVMKRREYLGVRMTYGQIGKASMGRLGSLLVNTSIMITQYGFCIGYFIFFGNTLKSVIFSLMHTSVEPFTNMTSNGSLPTLSPGTTGTPIITTTVPLTNSTPTTSTHSPNFTVSTGNVSDFDPFTEMFTSLLLKSTSVPLPQHSRNNTNATFLMHTMHAIKKILKQPLSHDNLKNNNEWTFTLLLVMPLPVLILISFVRQIRKLAPISVIANASITSAFAATAIFIIAEFKVPPEPLVYFNIETFPVFFGQVTAAYEGIGTVIPIEGSMAENRKKYPVYLYISLVLLTCILGSFGILGYARYGVDTKQIVTDNLTGISIANALRLLLFIGVLFTYPLQIYPVIQITESALFGRRGICRSRNGVYLLAGEAQGNVNEAPAVSEVRIAPWKRYVTRTFLVLSTAALAVVFRSQFAYIAALTGSIGSSLLSYILPCIFHLNLKRGSLSRAVRIKDILLILFGIAGGITGVTVTVQEIIKSYHTTK